MPAASAPTAGALRSTPSPIGPDVQDRLREHGSSAIAAAEQHGEEVERDRAEQHPRLDHEPDAGDEPGDAGRAVLVELVRVTGCRPRSAISAAANSAAAAP